MSTGGGGYAVNSQETQGEPRKSKPSVQSGGRKCKHRKFGRQLNFSSGKFEPMHTQKSKVIDFPPGSRVAICDWMSSFHLQPMLGAQPVGGCRPIFAEQLGLD